MTTENKTNLTVILDTIGRTILGENVSTTANSIQLKNPVILHIVPADNNGKMSVQLLPLFFREFLADKTGDVTFTYDADKIVTTDIDALDFRLQGQYSQMFNPQNSFVAPDSSIATPSSGEAEKVVNLFDE